MPQAAEMKHMSRIDINHLNYKPPPLTFGELPWLAQLASAGRLVSASRCEIPARGLGVFFRGRPPAEKSKVNITIRRGF